MGYQHDVEPTFLHPAEISLERTKNIFDTWILDLEHGHGNRHCTGIEYMFSPALYFWTESMAERAAHRIFNFDYTEVMNAVATGRVVAGTREKSLTISVGTGQPPDTTPPDPVPPPQVRITVRQVLDEGFLTNEFKSIAQELSLTVYTKWQQTMSYINKQDALAKTLEI